MTKRKPLPAQEYLRECFEYNPDTGELTWRHRPRNHFKSEQMYKRWNTRYALVAARSLCTEGYYVVCVDYETYMVHRVIWKLVHNEEPPYVDHEDRIKTNNILLNLRSANSSQNRSNASKSCRNASGKTGVHYSRKQSKWLASIAISGFRHHLGSFETFEAAKAARETAEIKYHGEFASFEQ